MKKIAIVCILALLLLGITVVASTNETHRVYVKGAAGGRAVAKGLFGSIHEFKNVHSVEVNPAQLLVLESIPGVEIEAVPFDYITAPPSKCGDGKCQGFESLATCPEDCTSRCEPDNEYPWGIQRINGGSGGSGITVAVLDTGLDSDHPDFPNIVGCYGTDYGTCEDGHSHGTFVAGIVLANGKIKGVAPEASLLVVKVCSDDGRCYDDDVADGIRYAVDHGANIISTSFGGMGWPGVEKKDALDYASGKGVLLVAAGGNSGSDENTIIYPAAYHKVMAVAAIDSQDVVANFSSRGLSNGDDVIDERELEVAAPGVMVESTTNNGCYRYGSGTSAAAPHVSGLAAKLWQGTAEATRYYLSHVIALDLDPAGHDTLTGFGIPVGPIEPECSSDLECNDGVGCTVDTCLNAGSIDASCSNTWPACGIVVDGCCGPACNSGNDADCDPTECGNGVCEGSGEDCSTCRLDCACKGKECSKSCCGNGVCEASESTRSCQTDCA